jgi:hypothetical protein
MYLSPFISPIFTATSINQPDEIEADENDEYAASFSKISQARIQPPGFNESLGQTHGSPGD